jgi:hypothetical protein
MISSILEIGEHNPHPACIPVSQISLALVRLIDINGRLANAGCGAALERP